MWLNNIITCQIAGQIYTFNSIEDYWFSNKHIIRYYLEKDDRFFEIEIIGQYYYLIMG